MRFIDNLMAKFGYAKALARNAELTDASKPKSIFKPIFLKFKTSLGGRNAELKEQEYEFQDIRKAVDVEPLLRQACEKFLQLMWKNGHAWVGKNQKAVDYVKLRMAQIAAVTGTPNQAFLDQASDELIRYSNVYIIPQRDASMSGGKPYINLFGKSVNPISGLFLAPASHMEPMVDQKTKQLVGWKSSAVQSGDKDMFFTKDEVIHVYMSRSVGNLTGTPIMKPVLGDVRALRRMEENAEALVFQNAFPLVHYRVGTKDAPEVDPNKFDEIKQKVEASSPQGMFVTPFDHDIKAVGNGDSPIDVEKYLNYFRLRIISGLGLSTVVFGESDSSNRGTAQVQDKGLQDGAKRFLSVLKTFINEQLVSEFLREGGFDPMDPENTVQLYTPEVDIDAKIKKETHIMSLYHGNLLTEDNARKEIGYDILTDEERKGLYFNLVEIPRAIILASDEPYTPEAKKKMGEGGTNLKIDKGTANKVRPTNQKGAKIDSKPPVNKSSVSAQRLNARVTDGFRRIAARALKGEDTVWVRPEFEALRADTLPALKDAMVQEGLSNIVIAKRLETYNRSLNGQGIINDTVALLTALRESNESSPAKIVSAMDVIRNRVDVIIAGLLKP